MLTHVHIYIIYAYVLTPLHLRTVLEVTHPLSKMDGKCRAENVIYQATVTTEQLPPVVDTYIGMTTLFKDRLRGHTSSFENEKFKNQTTLSQHIWSLKERSIEFKISWKIIGRAKSFNPVTGV